MSPLPKPPSLPDLSKLPDLSEPPRASTPFKILRRLLRGTRDSLKEVIEEVKELGQDMREK